MSAAILILITLSQLMLTSSASILTEEINDVTLLKDELNTFMAQDGNRKERSASGEFVLPPKVVDTTIVKNKLLELQNDATKLADAISNKNQNVDDIKNRISTLEEQIEDLIKQNDNKDREITQSQTKFQNILSDLLAKYNKREEELAKLQYEEFLEAIKHRYYQFAAVKIGIMEDETSAIKLVERVYAEIGDLPPLLEFADNVNNLKMKVLIYETIVYSYTIQFCLKCNVLLICNKVWKVVASNVFTKKLKERFTSTISFFYSQIVSRTDVRFCWVPPMKKDPELVKNLVERHCLSGKQEGSKQARHDYSGYCYPIDSIYSNFQ